MERMLAAPADAEIILRLYELRTETVMRQARAWITGEFWPETVEEFFAVSGNPADPHNAWFRQVITYWEMASAMVLHGAVSAELFVDCNAEGFFPAGQVCAHSRGHSGEKSNLHDQDLRTGEPLHGGLRALRSGAEERRGPRGKACGQVNQPPPKFSSGKTIGIL